MKEGRFQVALGLACSNASGAKAEVRVDWFARKEWIKTRRHEWSLTPTFEHAKDPDTRRRWNTPELSGNFVSVRPMLTKTTIAMSRTKTTPRLTAECVRSLEEYCKQYGLINEQAAEVQILDGDDDDDDGDDDGGEEEVCLLLATCYLLLATCYSLLATRYSLLVTRYSLLAARCSQLAAW